MSASGKSLLGLWLYRSGEQEWAVKEGSPIHKPKDLIGIAVMKLTHFICTFNKNKISLTQKTSQRKSQMETPMEMKQICVRLQIEHQSFLH